MRLRDLSTKEHKQIAQKVGTTYRYISQLAYGTSPNGKRRKPSPELAKKIEYATGGRVSRLELLYPDDEPRKKCVCLIP